MQTYKEEWLIRACFAFVTLVLTRSRSPCRVRQWPGGVHFNHVWLFLFPAQMQKHAFLSYGRARKIAVEHYKILHNMLQE